MLSSNHIRLFITCLFLSSFLAAQNNLSSDSTTLDTEKPKISLGGALRVHYKNEFYNESNKRQGGEFAYDVFSITATGSYKKFKMYGDMRFMAASYGGAMLREGWLGYNFENGADLQLGLIEDPFGNLQYNSYSWFLGIGYGLGFEGKYSLGAKYHHKGAKWDWQIAFMKNAMETFTNNPDLRDNQWSASVLGDLKEINQLSGQLVYEIKTPAASHRIGGSVKVGQLYNFTENRMGDRNAFAVHYHLEYKGFGIKAQAYKYQFNPKKENPKFVDVGAFNYTYQIGSKGNVYTLATKYSIPFTHKILNEIMVYSEYGHLQKTKDLKPSKMLTSGVMFRSFNSLFIYLEYATGQNHPYLGGNRNSLYDTYDNKWRGRIQCNFGYYF